MALITSGLRFDHRRKRVKTIINLLRIASNNADDIAFEDGFKAVLEGEGLGNEEAGRVSARLQVTGRALWFGLQ